MLSRNLCFFWSSDRFLNIKIGKSCPRQARSRIIYLPGDAGVGGGTQPCSPAVSWSSLYSTTLELGVVLCRCSLRCPETWGQRTAWVQAFRTGRTTEQHSRLKTANILVCVVRNCASWTWLMIHLPQLSCTLDELLSDIKVLVLYSDLFKYLS